MIGKRISHYEILAKLGEGGMGVVYRARDSRLQRTVALKFLPPNQPSDEEARARFLREARAAAALNHPNIATIYDIEEAEDLAFIAMEYVEGSTLKEKRVREGPLAIEDIVDIGAQIAEALKAAHERGVTHRDVKSSNVMLAPAGRVKVMDFGLAKIADYQTVTRTHNTPGTIAYMSPEQLQGRGGDARSDLWALGVILYEMSTGQLPFTGGIEVAVIYGIINNEPRRPRELRPDLPIELERIIMRALSKNPKRRYQSADEILADLRAVRAMTNGEAGAKRSTVAEPTLLHRLSGKPVALVAVLAAGLLIATAAAVILKRPRVDASSQVASMTPEFADAVEPRRSVAVLGFKNLSGDDDVAWISTALAEMLATELAAGRSVRMIPGELVTRMKMELAIPDEASFGEGTLQEIREYLGADLVVVGSYLALEDESQGGIRLDARVQDASAGMTLASVAETGDRSRLFDLIARAGTRLRQELGAQAASEATLIQLAATWPTSTAAARPYAQGLEHLRRLDALSARDLLERAVAEDPDFPLAHSALAEAWTKLGYDSKAEEAAKRAFDLADDLPEDQRLLIEARYREATGDWDRAIEIYSGLWRSSPDNYEHGLALVDAQTRAGNLGEASTTLEALHRLPAPAAEDARIDIAEAFVAEGLGEYERQRSACIAAREKASEQGATVLVGESWHMEGRSLFYLNQLEAALAAFQEGERIFERSGNRTEVANAVNAIGIVHRVRGERREALENFERALAIKRELGEQSGIAMVLGNIGIVHEALGDLERARAMQEEAAEINREIGATNSLVRTLINLGNVTKSLGQFARARDLYEEVAETAERSNSKQTYALALNNLSGVLHTLGELDEARETRERSLKLLREIDHKLLISYALYGLGEILKDQGDLAGARAKHDSSLAIREELKLGEVVASRHAIARVMLEEGDYRGAEAWLRGSATQQADKMTPKDSAFADALLAAALSGEGRLEEAVTLAEAALAREIEDVEDRLGLKLLTADALAAAGRQVAARELVQTTLQEARRTGHMPAQFEARLRLATIELDTGNAEAARASLSALSRDAARRGFHLVAEKAAGAAERSSAISSEL